MKSLECPSCGFSEIDPKKFIKKRKSQVDGVEYKAYMCQECDLIFWFPREMRATYYEEDFASEYKATHENRNDAEDIAGWRASDYYFNKYIEKDYNNLLDIGCSNGLFLSRLGGDRILYGIDFDRKSVSAAKERGLEKVYATSLADFIPTAREKNIEFDAITFFEVLEHQADPLGFLSDVKKLAGDDCLVIGTVPNRDRAFVDVYRASNEVDFPPHHFLWFSKRSLINLFKNAGLRDIKTFRADPRSLWYLVGGGTLKAMISLFKRLGRKFLKVKSDMSYERISKKWWAGLLNFVVSPVSLFIFLYFRLKPEKIFFVARC